MASNGIDNIIRLVDRKKPKCIAIKLHINGGSSGAIMLRELRKNTSVSLNQQLNLNIDYGLDYVCGSVHELRDRDSWERLGKRIGRKEPVRALELSGDLVDANGIIGSEKYECIEALYRGMESNPSLVEELQISMNLYPDNHSLPTLNLLSEHLKENLKHLKLTGDDPMTNNQSIMISSVLENTSLKKIDMWGSAGQVLFGPSNEEAFRRIVTACYTADSVWVNCQSSSQYFAIADLIRNPRSISHTLKISGSIEEEGYYIIADGLAGNTRLKKLSIPGYESDAYAIAAALCNPTSIENICNSNHTLEEIEFRYGDINCFLRDCLELNKNANKETVIQRKIFQFYFIGNFDTAPFSSMPVSVLPKVLSMIKGRKEGRQQSAIFRMLTSIPELCNVSSRKIIKHEKFVSNDVGSKRQKTCT
eukprot:scaffold33190_cov37-Cyclotella_meneghiniana.AAC.4